MQQWQAYQDDPTELAKTQILQHAKPLLRGLTKSELRHIGLIYPPRLAWSQSEVDSINFHGVTIPVITFPVSALPELGNQTLWIDRGHLNQHGATMITRHIADNICG